MEAKREESQNQIDVMRLTCKGNGLTESERAGLVRVLVPESIAGPQISKGFADDASENGSDHAASQGPLRHSGRPQVDIIGRVVNGSEMFQRVVGEGVGQVPPAVGLLQPAASFFVFV
jgi:hypothetical protein